MATQDRSAVGLDLSGLGLIVEGLPQALADRLRRDWSSFVTDPMDGPFLRLTVTLQSGGAEEMGPFGPKAMRSSLKPGKARFWMPEGSVDVRSNGDARIRLTCADLDRAYYTMLNLLRASLAWTMPTRGGALLHAAGLGFDHGAFLLVGAEGSGKSTWARLGEEGGAHVISDDLVLIDGIGSRIEVLGSPFRSTHVGRLRRGRWPLEGILFPLHGDGATLVGVGRLAAHSRLLANLPFVAEGIERDSRIPPLLDRLAGEVACRELSFGLDGAFVELLRRWDGGAHPSGRIEP